jgi:hypothetical protein
MLNKKTNLCVLFLLIFCFLQGVSAQTMQWRVIWDRNSTEDNVDYYNVYRKIGSAATVNDPVLTQVPEPTAQNQDSVMFIDTNLQTATHYFYAIQAVDLQGSQSQLSLPESAAIPKILFDETMVLKADTTYLMPLNHESIIDDPDHDPSELVWSLSGSNQISGSIDSTNNILTIDTPADTTISETFQFTVTDPDEFFDSKSMTITLTAETPTPPPPPPPPGDDVEKVVAYPIPFVGSNPPPCDCINFQFPTSSNAQTLLIFSVMGDLVFSVSDLSDNYEWKVVNSNGKKISPGLYLYYVQDDKGEQVASGKLVVIR